MRALCTGGTISTTARSTGTVSTSRSAGPLRGRLLDALIDLGRRYEGRGDSMLAAARFREALAIAGGEFSSASEGLHRLGVPIG